MKTYTIGLFYLIILSAFTTVVKAQEKQVKLSKELKEALEMRYQTDQYTAKTQRMIFNKMEWKNSWIGVKYSDLLKSWGAPTRAFPSGDGGQVVVYEKVSNYAGGSYKPGYLTTAINGVGQRVITGSKEAEDTRWASQYVEITTLLVGKDNLIKSIDQKTTRSQAGSQ